MKVGQSITLDIQEISTKGEGVATVEGQSLLLRETLPGDRVQAVVTRVRRGVAEGRVVEIESPGPGRIVPRCRHFGPCGGCSLQHMDYPQQVVWKSHMVQEVFRKEGLAKQVPPLTAVPMEDPWRYRAKLEFTFGQEEERILLGFHRRSSFQRIVDIEHCEIAPAPVSALLGAIRETAARFPQKAYNPNTHQGFWRYAVVRVIRWTGGLMLTLVTHDGPREPLEAMAVELPKRVPELRSLHWGISTKVSDVAQMERSSLMWGEEELEDRIGAVRFMVGPKNFVQPNLLLAEKVYDAIRRKAGLTGREAVYDLYCGIGLIALTMASEAKVVYGVESEAENIASAERNAALNGVGNAVFLAGKVEDVLRGRALFRAGPAPDVIVLDPPRAGLHGEVFGPLLQSQARRLLYLSCNPASLARDLKVILDRDPKYRVESLQLFDFFPQTTHAEVLAVLCYT
ncbi:MAG: 23S rRNA (uracil(1939)-C(5))-methyltransferase RlmD [Candidatus Omnitrophica bacterium]|nr:23S rRNA (uracil(1939)-C(5))-methyltransferase RlmD [Candidatus Omnitrophota bacterium]